MAYNPSMYNPYSYGNTYGQYPQTMAQSQPVSYASSTTQGMVWVDGETEAKGKPIPAGAMQFAMWDINEPVIYIKSMNPMGIPNPLRKIHYQVEEMQTSTQGGSAKLQSGEEEKEDTTQYVKKDELKSMKDEIMQAIRDMKSESATSSTMKRTMKGE